MSFQSRGIPFNVNSRCGVCLKRVEYTVQAACSFLWANWQLSQDLGERRFFLLHACLGP